MESEILDGSRDTAPDGGGDAARDGGRDTGDDTGDASSSADAAEALDAEVLPDPIEYPQPRDCVLSAQSESDAGGNCVSRPDAGYSTDGCEPYEQFDGTNCELRCVVFPCSSDCDCPESRGGSECSLVAGEKNCVFFAEQKERCETGDWLFASMSIKPGNWGPILCPDDPQMRCYWEFTVSPTGRFEWHYRFWHHETTYTVGYSMLAPCDHERIKALIRESNAGCAIGDVFDHCVYDSATCEVGISTPDGYFQFDSDCTAHLDLPGPLYQVREALWRLAFAYFKPTIPGRK